MMSRLAALDRRADNVALKGKSVWMIFSDACKHVLGEVASQHEGPSAAGKKRESRGNSLDMDRLLVRRLKSSITEERRRFARRSDGRRWLLRGRAAIRRRCERCRHGRRGGGDLVPQRSFRPLAAQRRVLVPGFFAV
jgi:hypothetical protein